MEANRGVVQASDGRDEDSQSESTKRSGLSEVAGEGGLIGSAANGSQDRGWSAGGRTCALNLPGQSTPAQALSRLPHGPGLRSREWPLGVHGTLPKDSQGSWKKCHVVQTKRTGKQVATSDPVLGQQDLAHFIQGQDKDPRGHLPG